MSATLPAGSGLRAEHLKLAEYLKRSRVAISQPFSGRLIRARLDAHLTQNVKNDFTCDPPANPRRTVCVLVILPLQPRAACWFRTLVKNNEAAALILSL